MLHIIDYSENPTRTVCGMDKLELIVRGQQYATDLATARLMVLIKGIELCEGCEYGQQGGPPGDIIGESDYDYPHLID